MQQMNLFNTSSSIAGFRLDYMEIYNWGTFDKEIFRIDPQGNNSLLTGANASGKSTLIDALLTLLVPLKRNRFYNQSSGIEKKGDRTEESYFFGNYGNQQEEGGTGTKTLRLRDKSSRSVLLACFKSADERCITLFQVRYHTGEELKTVYGIGKTRLTIADDLKQFDSKGVWRRHLEKAYNANSVKKVVEFCSGPVEYGERICDLFGMRSDKALQLFNQIVGVKVLDDLDNFIRLNMLEELPAEAKYIELKENFQNLMEAKLSIDKANLQITQLGPIVHLAEALEEIQGKLLFNKQETDFMAYWFARRTVALCEEEILHIGTDLQQLERDLEKLKAEREQTDGEKTKLQVAIENDEIGKQLRKLEADILQLEAERDKRKKAADFYDELAQKVDLIQSPQAADFLINKRKAQSEKERFQQEIDEMLAEQLRTQEGVAEQIRQEIEENVDTVKYLQSHQHNITGRIAEIREEILQHTGATADEIPFIGELIQVKENEQAWEASIEKILHNFALRLIVPEKYYEQVNEFVNSHNLKGRLVYQRYREFTSLKEMEGWQIEANSLFHKVDFKTDHAYTAWVEDMIYHEFNYACVDNLKEFACYEEKAVTREGLVKAAKGKHEKDDRPQTLNREHYVLGWNNKEKIRTLQEMVRDLQEKQKLVQEKIRAVKAERQEKLQLIEWLSQLQYRFDAFDSIDWKTCAQRIQEKTDAKQALEASNNRIKTLQEQLKQVTDKLHQLEADIEQLQRKKYKSEDSRQQLEEKHAQSMKLIAQLGEVDTADFEQRHPELSSVQLDKLEAYTQEFQQKNGRERKDLEDKKDKHCRKVANLINKFKNPPAEITDQFKDWRSDVNSLPESEHLELIGEYQSYYKRLVEEDLISFQERFNKYLQETITHHVNSFRIFFHNWEDAIKKTIEQLNAPLQNIDFSQHPATYIQLMATRKFDVDINEFKEMLDQAVPNLHELDNTIDGRKHHFEHCIEPFIKRLEDEQWRSKVMDVRAWYTYKAEEFYKETQQKHKTYESMGQLSGGEKAQLTYTILGSAIACQFGLTQTGRDSSFRFIAIDEAFKAQDESKARYLISLCRQLHLQLLVVTPSDNIHIVENDISYVHYVERNGNRSVLYNMPILQYKEEQQKHVKG